MRFISSIETVAVVVSVGSLFVAGRLVLQNKELDQSLREEKRRYDDLQNSEQELKKRYEASLEQQKGLEHNTASLTQSLKDERRRYDELHQSEQQVKKEYATIVEEQRRLKYSTTLRGRSGESILQQVLEEAKRQSFIQDFELQPLIDNGTKKPDGVVTLKNGSKIVVDSKAPGPPNELLSAVSLGTTNDVLRKKYVQQTLQTHIRDLSRKGYQTSVPNSLSRTIMMLPGEGYVQAAYDANGVDDMKLHSYAAEKNIFIVGPNGLRSILYLLELQQTEEAQTQILADENVQQVMESRLQPIWTDNVLPQMRKITMSLNRFVKEVNDLGDDIKSFDTEFRGKDVLNIPKAKKTKLPKEIKQPENFQIIDNDTVGN